MEVNSVIGRTAHISYLDNAVVASQVVRSLQPYFL
jgi:hypothetical protein